MVRRKTINATEIKRVEGIPYRDAWVAYQCVGCRRLNHVRIGQELLSPKEAVENCIWECKHCEFIHSKESDLPFENWGMEYNDSESMTTLRFWEGFFRIATEQPESYWKQCNVCCRILSFQAFSKHSGWGPLERQMECRSCKGAIDHILPSKYLYPLKKENAALLSKSANENKRDRWPSKFYTNNELIELAKITGADLGLISGKHPVRNHDIDVDKGVERYLQVREESDLAKRIKEIKKILQHYGLVDRLSPENKKLLNFD